jgi:GT2 family glycosyltransferase
MPANYGFGAACNAGAALAVGHLMLLNSDVLPVTAGWLGRLAAALETSSRIGAVGPKLLYYGDSLQHAGVYFAQDNGGNWRNMHFYKGYPRDYPEANQARSVPGVTGAAILVRRHAFERIGGFTEDYIIADYEDSDLCFKLRAEGFDIWYAPAAELYHFERQSLPFNHAYWRSSASEYNRVLHARLWRHTMAELAEQGTGVGH